jgi:hypothetical protein
MGLRPTHTDESPFLAPIDSKRVMHDFRRSVVAPVTYTIFILTPSVLVSALWFISAFARHPPGNRPVRQPLRNHVPCQ